MDTFDMTREEKFEFYWKRIHQIVKLKPDAILKQESGSYWQWCTYFGEVVSPLYQHQVMFVACLEFLCTEEQ